ncbi:PA2169 family four-helix-bundle protein [Edaphobacter aggregans]|uniref:PA2169 family four-helix-bundle protein n=1 Tax=Edaphobacter aggregans TaxID=570835 RepID=UPI000551130F|nr:PA2169 family four-helix-bundle protein [Edaphobacter aggregans]
MATDAGKRNEMQLAVLSVISTLLDGQKGFAEIGDHLKDETLKRYFLAESLKRAQFRGDLEEVLHQNGVHDIKESGSVAGTLHRVWGDLKAKLGGGDHALLATAEQGEDAAKEAYADALKQNLPLPVRQLLAEQQAHILSSHDYVRSQRDALAAKK